MIFTPFCKVSTAFPSSVKIWYVPSSAITSSIASIKVKLPVTVTSFAGIIVGIKLHPEKQ